MSESGSRNMWAAFPGGLSFVVVAARRVALVGLMLAVASGSARAQQVDAPASPIRQGAVHYGPFVAGGVGTGQRSSFSFLNAGVQAGYVVTPNLLSGLLRGNFEYGVEVVPFWQSYTPRQNFSFPAPGRINTFRSGGTYTGVALTPIILRWNFTHGESRLVPWAQGAGGLLYTTHKYPLPGTSVWNFEPQFGIGAHYFVSDHRSIDLGANAIHISNASLGDRNPGVNALVQFQLGYTWWKR